MFAIFYVDESGPVPVYVFFSFTMISYVWFEDLLVHLFITDLILHFSVSYSFFFKFSHSPFPRSSFIT